jgi:FkbH-like protein
MYALGVARESEKARLSIDDYLRGLQMKVKVFCDREADVVRLSQLSLKTNQFNVSAMRYSEQSLKEIMNQENGIVLSARLEDKFGDEGIVALIVVETEKDVAFIKEFVMSCRVMKRTVEFAVLEKLESILKEKGVKKIFAKYVKSEKNAPVEFLFDECGFSLMKNEHEEKEYVSPIPREVKKTHFCEIVD